MDQRARTKTTNRIAILGILANTFLLIIKLLVGFVFNSQGMLADGLNSAGDVFSSVMTLIGSKISSKPSDKDHHYGHGKAEYIFSFIISISLLAVAASGLKNSIKSLAKGDYVEFSILLIAAGITTIVVKLCLFLYTDKMAKRYNSLLIKTNALDHRNDVLLTTGTIIGIMGSKVGMNWADGVVGILISLYIAFTGLQVFKEAYDVLMDIGVGKGFQKHLEADIMAIKGVDHIDDIRTQPIGAQHILILRISVDPDMTVRDSHSIADEVEETILKDHSDIAEVIVHVNPQGEH